MAFKMKSFSGFGNSPMKQKGFIRTPDNFDHAKARANAKKQFNIHGAKTGHGTIRDLENKNKKNFDKFKNQKTKAKDFVKKLKPQIKTGYIKPVSTLSKVLRGSGIGLVGEYLYQAYKRGKKHGFKIDPNQKSIITEGKKKIDKSKFNVSIFKMKGFSGFGNESPAKNLTKKEREDKIDRDYYEAAKKRDREKIKKAKAKNKKFDFKGYFEGKQGLIPDYKGKPTRQRLNESTFFNPRSAAEIGSDQTDSRILTRLLKDQFEREDKGIKTSKAEANYLKYYLDKSKKRRPNRKDRF